MKETQRDRRGRWRNGSSGNPAGRPVGSRNRSTVLLESILTQNGEKLMRKTVQLGLKGDPTALRLCVEPLLPPCKDRPIYFNLPSNFVYRDISDICEAVLDAIAAGEITPTEGQLLANFLTAQSQIARTEKEMKQKEEDRWKQNLKT